MRHTSKRQGKKGGKRKHVSPVLFYEAAATSNPTSKTEIMRAMAEKLGIPCFELVAPRVLEDFRSVPGVL